MIRWLEAWRSDTDDEEARYIIVPVRGRFFLLRGEYGLFGLSYHDVGNYPTLEAAQKAYEEKQ